MKEKYLKLLIGLSVVCMVVGAWGVIKYALYGHITVAYGSYVPWGLWVALYIFFLGLTAGAFLITILTYVFRIKIFAGIGPLSAFTVVITIICEIFMIAFDLGHPFRVYRFLVTPNLKSMITWMVIFTVGMLVIYVLETFYLLREELIRWSQNGTGPGPKIYRLLVLGKTTYTEEDRRRDHRYVRILSIISIPVGLFFYGSNGGVFAVLLSRPIWNSALTPLLFIVTALVSGGAFMTLLTFMFQRDDAVIHPLGHTIRFLLVVVLILEFLQFFVGYQSDVVMTVTSLNLILFGPYWWTFWIVHLGIGSLLPIYLMVAYHEDSRVIAWACVLIVLTFVTVRLNFVIPDLAVYKLEGLQNTFFHYRLRTDYTPNLNEWLVSIWVISGALLTFLLGTRWLPILSAGKGEEEHV